MMTIVVPNAANNTLKPRCLGSTSLAIKKTEGFQDIHGSLFYINAYGTGGRRTDDRKYNIGRNTYGGYVQLMNVMNSPN
jgi:hypothetical protein